MKHINYFEIVCVMNRISGTRYTIKRVACAKALFKLLTLRLKREFY